MQVQVTFTGGMLSGEGSLSSTGTSRKPGLLLLSAKSGMLVVREHTDKFPAAPVGHTDALALARTYTTPHCIPVRRLLQV